MSECQQIEMVTVKWDGRECRVPSVPYFASDLITSSPWVDWDDRWLDLNGVQIYSPKDGIDIKQPTIKDGDVLTSVPYGYY